MPVQRGANFCRWLCHALGLSIAGLTALALWAPVASAAEDEAAWLFDPGSVVEIDLGLSPGEMDALELDRDEYQPGTFQLRLGGEVQGPPLGDVGIRLKGGIGSKRPLSAKTGFKIKFNEYAKKQTLFGLKRLTLNNMVQDPSMLHETLTYELFGALGLPASRTGYAFVRLNGEIYGVYLNIETLDSISLSRWFDSTGHLYEADTPGVDLAPGRAGDFEVDEGDDEEIGDLENLIAAASADEGDWSDGMAGVADLTQMTRMWAIERYVGHWDGYAGGAGGLRPNNYYVHSDAAGLFSMLPWGADQTWGARLEFDEQAGGRLFNSCLADESCKALYVDALREVQSTVGGLDLDARVTELADLLAPCQTLEAEPRREYTGSQIEQGVGALRAFIAERPAELAAWLGPPSEPPSGAPSPAVSGEEPCSSLLPQRPGARGGAPGPASVPTLRLRIGPSRAAGGSISTRLDVPGAGWATQRATATFEGRRRTVCRGRAHSHRAGPLTVSCRLSIRAQRRLASGSLRLRVKVGFAPRAGRPSFDTRRLTVPKRLR